MVLGGSERKGNERKKKLREIRLRHSIPRQNLIVFLKERNKYNKKNFGSLKNVSFLIFFFSFHFNAAT